MTIRKRRRIRLIVLGVVLLGLAAVAIGYGFRNSIEYFKSPTQITDEGAPDGRFRIGGLVVEGSLAQEGEEVSFQVTDTTNTLEVRYSGLLPDLFAENQGVIARGVMNGETFVADEILAKHDESYMPREVVDALKEQGVYQE